MTVSSVFSAANTSATGNTTTSAKTNLGAMDANDFLKLLTVQMKQQDPTDPVDQKEMLAQMAQFSTLSSTAEMNASMADMKSTLTAIAVKLGAIDPTPTNDSTGDTAA